MSDYTVDTITLPDFPNLRARIVVDESADEPDHDGQAYIFEVSDRDGSVTVRHADCGFIADQAAVLSHALADANNRFGDWETTERYLRIFADVISFDRWSTRDSEVIALTTRDLAESWGCTADDAQPSATATLSEYSKWAEGEVYGRIVEKRVTWVQLTEDGDLDRDVEPMDDWAEVEDGALWGLIGFDWATQEATDALQWEADEARGYRLAYFLSGADNRTAVQLRHNGELVGTFESMDAGRAALEAHARLEYLRGELRAQRISYGEMAELQGLAEYIDPSDVELLEPAGVPEYPQDGCADCAAGHPVSHSHDDDATDMDGRGIDHGDYIEYPTVYIDVEDDDAEEDD